MKAVPPFPYYGGKSRHLRFILPKLPQTKRYCEPFAGAASVLLSRDPVEVETYNDLDSNIVIFFRVLREQTEDLLKSLELTPFSQEEFKNALITLNTEGHSDLERARSFFIRATMSRGARPYHGAWNPSITHTRREMSGAVGRYQVNLERLELIASRLLRVQITNDDALKIIRKYDTQDTLFYVDPPYYHGSRSNSYCYKYEMSSVQHRHLAYILNNVEGYVAISGYHSDFFDELYEGWYCSKDKINRNNELKSERQEILWTNYDPETFEKLSIKQAPKQTKLEEVVQ
ncbi:DNA adenine methylase [Candidatus Methanomassiliicoccus intestinalis]|uniref:DNA adenine methylase n=1 Tax=Candidatus Methanomassiliicoccus intestinalis TaxID=1406512 RepID=UPI0037DDE2F3